MGADVNAESAENIYDGCTALMFAAGEGHL